MVYTGRGRDLSMVYAGRWFMHTQTRTHILVVYIRRWRDQPVSSRSMIHEHSSVREDI